MEENMCCIELIDREWQTKEIALQMIEHVELMRKFLLARAFRGELATN